MQIFANLHCVAQTLEAVMCIFQDGRKVWVPQSQIHEDSEVWRKGDFGILVISEWFAIEKGMV